MNNWHANILDVVKSHRRAFVLFVILLFTVLIGGLSSCTAADTGSNANKLTYEHLGYSISLPGNYTDRVTLTSQDELDDHTLIEAYYGKGFMFRLVRNTPAKFEKYWPEKDMIGGAKHFAKDQNYYYSYETPTDVQYDPEVEGAAEEYHALCDSFDLSSFIADNNLVVYDHHKTIYEPEYTYPGKHAIFEFTLSNGEKNRLVLSKPIRQGVDGIWCVERMYDEQENLYLAMPKTDLTAMEYYTELQSQVDGGHRPGLRDVKDVALTYLMDVWDYARHITESDIIYIDDPSDSHSF